MQTRYARPVSGGCSARKIVSHQENAAVVSAEGVRALAGEDESVNVRERAIGHNSTPPVELLAEASDPDRVARVTALVWTPADAPAQNLFTLVRERAAETLQDLGLVAPDDRLVQPEPGRRCTAPSSRHDR